MLFAAATYNAHTQLTSLAISCTCSICACSLRLQHVGLVWLVDSALAGAAQQDLVGGAWTAYKLLVMPQFAVFLSGVSAEGEMLAACWDRSWLGSWIARPACIELQDSTQHQ
jgi:hypothetical protein